jgi:hypothetical protein
MNFLVTVIEHPSLRVSQTSLYESYIKAFNAITSIGETLRLQTLQENGVARVNVLKLNQDQLQVQVSYVADKGYIFSDEPTILWTVGVSYLTGGLCKSDAKVPFTPCETPISKDSLEPESRQSILDLLQQKKKLPEPLKFSIATQMLNISRSDGKVSTWHHLMPNDRTDRIIQLDAGRNQILHRTPESLSSLVSSDEEDFLADLKLCTRTSRYIPLTSIFTDTERSSDHPNTSLSDSS